jgi:regulator of protease activity HflC (stomatin/prohibitin superfamily)
VLLTIVFILGTLGAVGGAALIVRRKRLEDPAFAGGVGLGIAFVGVVIGLLTCFSTVDARAVGIQTSFGKYHDTLSSGFQWTAPWTSVEDWTTRNQTIRFAGDGKAEERDNYFTEPFITVRLGNQSEAYVDATVTWNITEKSVEGLWKQYKTFQDARQDFATPTAQGAANSAFDGYDPFAALNNTSADNPYIPLEEWSKRIAEKLRPLYAARNVELINVQVTKVGYDKRTEDKLREYADSVANTRIAAQNVETAKKEAEASAARKTTSGNDCISLIRDLAAQNQLQHLAPGTNICGGTSTPVIVGK